MAAPVVAVRRVPLGPCSYQVAELREQYEWDEMLFSQWCIDECLFGSLAKDMWRLEYEEAFCDAARRRDLFFASPGAALVQPPPLSLTFWFKEPKALSPCRALAPSRGRPRGKPYLVHGVDLTAELEAEKQETAWSVKHVGRGLQ